MAAPQAPEGHDTDRFANTFYVLLESYRKKRGRTLDPDQVQTLVDAFTEVSDLNQALAGEVTFLRQQLEEEKEWLKKLPV
jgi:hypothetical protein